MRAADARGGKKEKGNTDSGGSNRRQRAENSRKGE